MKLKRLQEKIIYSRLQNKDKNAFIQAYDLYTEQIYRFIFFKVNSKEEAEDLTSTVFLKTWSYIQEGNLGDYKTLKALIYKIARNLVIDHYRKISNQENIAIEQENGPIEIADKKQDILKKIEIISDYKLIEEKLDDLKDEYREVIILRFINELSIYEIADILNKSRSNTRVLIYRALKALKELTKN